MKISSKNTKPLETNSEVNDVMKFTLKNPGKIMTVFRDNMYKHKFRTMVQEYMCNARDGVRERLFSELRAENKISGKDVSNLIKIEDLYCKLKNHIEVWVPTQLDLFFRVRDYGVGISPERMRDVFLDFGSSTKNENYSTGGFGFGGKIGFAVSDSFSITSWYNGVKYEYLATLLNDPDGELIELSKTETKEPNGVMIEVPIAVEQIGLIQTAILRTCLFWKTKPVIHNVGDLSFDWSKIDYLYKNNHSSIVTINKESGFFDIKEKILTSKDDRFFVLIDDIVYPINSNLLTTEGGIKITTLLRKNQAVLLNANIGVLDIIANREEIAINDKNNNLINSMFHQVANEFTKFLDDHVSNAKNFNELILAYDFLNKNSWLMKIRKAEKTGEIVARNGLSFNVDSDASVIRVRDHFSRVVFKKESMNNTRGYCVSKQHSFQGVITDLISENLNKIKFYTNAKEYEETRIRGIATNLIRCQNVDRVVILRPDVVNLDFFNATDISEVTLVKEDEQSEIKIERKKPRKEIIEYIPIEPINNYNRSKKTAQLCDFSNEDTIIYLTNSSQKINWKGADLLVRDLICDLLKQDSIHKKLFIITNERSLSRIESDKRFVKAMDFLSKVASYYDFQYIVAKTINDTVKSSLIDKNFIATKNIRKIAEFGNKDLIKYLELMMELDKCLTDSLSNVKVLKYDKVSFWVSFLNKEDLIKSMVAKLVKKFDSINKITEKYPLLQIVRNDEAINEPVYSTELAKYVTAIFLLDKKQSK